MTESEQTKALYSELDKVISRFAAEFDVTYATVVGVLGILQSTIITRMHENDRDGNEES